MVVWGQRHPQRHFHFWNQFRDAEANPGHGVSFEWRWDGVGRGVGISVDAIVPLDELWEMSDGKKF